MEDTAAGADHSGGASAPGSGEIRRRLDLYFRADVDEEVDDCDRLEAEPARNEPDIGADN